MTSIDIVVPPESTFQQIFKSVLYKNISYYYNIYVSIIPLLYNTKIIHYK